MPINIMLPIEVNDTIKTLGERIKLARLRRQMSQDELVRKCGISRRTLYAIEQGTPGIAAGTVLLVLWALGLLDSAKQVADPDADEHGKILEAARRKTRVRNPAPLDNDF